MNNIAIANIEDEKLEKLIKKTFTERENCPDAKTLIDFATGELSPYEYKIIKEHVSHCPLCQVELEEINKTITKQKWISMDFLFKRKPVLVPALALILLILIIPISFLFNHFDSSYIEKGSKNKIILSIDKKETLILDITGLKNIKEKDIITVVNPKTKEPVAIAKIEEIDKGKARAKIVSILNPKVKIKPGFKYIFSK